MERDTYWCGRYAFEVSLSHIFILLTLSIIGPSKLALFWGPKHPCVIQVHSPETIGGSLGSLGQPTKTTIKHPKGHGKTHAGVVKHTAGRFRDSEWWPPMIIATVGGWTNPSWAPSPATKKNRLNNNPLGNKWPDIKTIKNGYMVTVTAVKQKKTYLLMGGYN